MSPEAGTARATSRRRAEDATRPSLFDVDLKGIVLALFLCAGLFKSEEMVAFLPVDPTLLMAVLVVISVIAGVLRQGGRMPRNLGGMVGLFLMFTPALLITQWGPYPTEYVTYLFTLTLLVSVGTFFLFPTWRDFSRFMNAFLWVSILVSMLGISALVTVAGDETRLTVLASGPIGLGRVTGIGFLWLIFLSLDQQVSLLRALALMIPLVAVMLAAGSRGPLAGAMLAASVVGILFYALTTKGLIRYLLLASAILAAGWVALGYAPEGSSLRVKAFFEGDLKDSPEEAFTRSSMFIESTRGIAASPLGLGWGGYAVNFTPWAGQARAYPHNIFLEILLEGGWAAGGYFIALCLVTFGRAYRAARADPRARALFGALVFVIFNACVSGNLNDNRMVFCFLAMALVLPIPAPAPLLARTGEVSRHVRTGAASGPPSAHAGPPRGR